MIDQVSDILCIQMIFNPKFFNILNFTEIENEMFSDIFPTASDFHEKCSTKTGRIFALKLSNEMSMEISIVFNKILKEFGKKEHSYHTMIKGLILELIVILSRKSGKSKMSEIKNPVDMLIDHIDENYCEEINLGDLSALVNLNPSYISRLFSEKKGVTIFEYINEKRILKAAHLLKNTVLSVIEISMMVGYNNLSFFNRTFKKLMNMSPKEYRR
jgi:YesN/AraC family two-component response regulator